MNTTIKKILVPVDFKAESLSALQHAAEVALRNKAIIYLLHVIKKPSLLEKLFYFSRVNRENEQKKSFLATWKKTVEQQYQVPVLDIILEGNICFQIHQFTVSSGIDFIFMGFSRQQGIYSKFSGSKSRKISRQSGVPVATIFHHSGLPFKWKNVVIPVSSLKPEMRIRMLLHFAMQYRIKIHFVAVHDSTMDHSTEKFDLLVECIKLVKMFGNIAVDCKNLEDDDLTNAAWKYAKKIDADALITNSGNEMYRTEKSLADAEQDQSEQIILTVGV